MALCCSSAISNRFNVRCSSCFRSSALMPAELSSILSMLFSLMIGASVMSSSIFGPSTPKLSRNSASSSLDLLLLEGTTASQIRTIFVSTFCSKSNSVSLCSAAGSTAPGSSLEPFRDDCLDSPPSWSSSGSSNDIFMISAQYCRSTTTTRCSGFRTTKLTLEFMTKQLINIARSTTNMRQRFEIDSYCLTVARLKRSITFSYSTSKIDAKRLGCWKPISKERPGMEPKEQSNSSPGALTHTLKGP
mmetsp:Transcript_79844/g.191669  ORF Transcript_79844/g.191669 Transcript_79844/m.191669 type:complete len:246 (+) Transcript_79844:1168-1905(+)